MMKVQLSVPTSILLEREVDKINADGAHGNFCILPRHTDFLSPLVPGILVFTEGDGNELYFANDYGLLVKQGRQVFIAARHALPGESLATLERTARQRFVELDEIDRASQAAFASLEASFLRKFLETQKEFA